MTSHTFEVSLELGDLRVGFKKVLRVEITIGTDLLIQVELKLKLSLSFKVLFLELSDQVIL